MCWEALNNIAAGDLPIVIVVNDNGRSYDRTVGGLAQHLARLRMTQGYERALGTVKSHPEPHPAGRRAGLRGAARAQARDQGLPAAAGAVRGPRPEVRRSDRRARHRRDRGGAAAGAGVRRPGDRARGDGQGLRLPAGRRRRGRLPAQRRHHRPGDRQAGRHARRAGLTSVFSEEIVKIGAERPDVVAITAAMLQPVGLHAFADGLPRAHLRRRHRRAARGHLGRGPGHGRACTRSSACTRPSSTGRSTRCSWTSPCTGCR